MVPSVRARAQASGDVVLIGRIRVTDHLKWVGIVENNHAAECKRRRLMAQVAADVSNAEPTLWVAHVRLLANGSRKTSRVLFVPATALSLVVSCSSGWKKIKRKYQIGVRYRCVRIGGQRAPETIDRAVNALVGDHEAQIATTSEPITNSSEILNRSVVKVAVDDRGYATEFSRNPIPFLNQAVAKHDSIEAALRNPEESGLLFTFRKHTGLYAYRREFLLEFPSWPQSERERKESLEQLRALDRDVKIKVVAAASSSIGVDTIEDLERVRAIVEYAGTHASGVPS